MRAVCARLAAQPHPQAPQMRPPDPCHGTVSRLRYRPGQMHSAPGSQLPNLAACSAAQMAAPRAQAWWQSATGVFALIGGYFALQLGLRLLLSPSLETDEAEQLFLARTLRLSYGAQPPLYGWLQHGFFRVFGPGLFAIALLKNLLLAATYLGVFAAARRLVPPAAAALATFSLLLMPQIAWESQRDLSHTVLATALAAATLRQALATLEAPRLTGYLALGMLVGLGTLAKYNYLLFAAGLFLAALLTPPLRARIAWRALAFGALVALSLMSLQLFAALQGEVESFRHVDEKIRRAEEAAWLGPVLEPLVDVVTATLAFCGLFGIVVLAVFGRSVREAPAEARAPGVLLLQRYLPAAIALLALAALAAQTSSVKERWLQPLLFCVPLAFFASRPHLAAGARAGRFAAVLALCAALVSAGLVLRVTAAGSTRHFGDLSIRYDELGAALLAEAASGPLLVIADSNLVAGNLVRSLPPLIRVETLQTLQTPQRPQEHARLVLVARSEHARARLMAAFAAEHFDTLEIAQPYRHAGSGAAPHRHYLALAQPEPGAAQRSTGTRTVLP